MILRENRVNPNSKHVKFAISYGMPDIKRFVSMFIDTFTMGDADLMVLLKSSIINENEMRQYLEKTPYIFGWVDERLRKQLSAWAFRQMVDEEFLLPSAVKENAYKLSDKCYLRAGRPKGS